MSNTTKTKKIVDFWNDDEESLKKQNKEKRLKSLQRDAEQAVAKMATEAETAEDTLEAAIRSALVGGQSVETLFLLKRQAKVAKAKHADALSDYEEFFGEKPKLQ